MENIMPQIDPSLVRFTKHFNKQFREKGFKAEQIKEALTNPYKVTDVTRHPGQKRYCGGGVAVVMVDNVALTVYADGVVTPLREDQKNDPAALNSTRLNRK
jgi:hypothetical protein